MLPEPWKQMPQEYAKIKYPSEFRPEIIITTSDISVNLGFTVFPDKIQSDDTMKMVERTRAAIYTNWYSGKGCIVTDQAGNTETFRYDKEGGQTMHTDRKGIVTETRYNVYGQPALQTCTDKEEFYA